MNNSCVRNIHLILAARLNIIVSTDCNNNKYQDNTIKKTQKHTILLFTTALFQITNDSD